MALATCVTIGGVYATWLYADQSATGAYTSVGLQMSGISTDNVAMGSLGVTSVGTTMAIDDPTDADVHTTVLDWNVEGYFLVTFTTSANAEGDVKANGIPLQWRLGLADHTTATPTPLDSEKIASADKNEVTGLDSKVIYDNQAIFSAFDSNAVVINTTNANRQDNGDGTITFTYKIWLGEILFTNYTLTNPQTSGAGTRGDGSVERFGINKIQLPTREAYNAYQTTIQNLKIHFHVEPVPAQQG